MADENKSNENKLSSEVAEKYELVGIPPAGVVLPKRFGGDYVDFRKMTLAQAEALMKRKAKAKDKDGKEIEEAFPYLKLKSSSSSEE